MKTSRFRMWKLPLVHALVRSKSFFRSSRASLSWASFHWYAVLPLEKMMN